MVHHEMVVVGRYRRQYTGDLHLPGFLRHRQPRDQRQLQRWQQCVQHGFQLLLLIGDRWELLHRHECGFLPSAILGHGDGEFHDREFGLAIGAFQCLVPDGQCLPRADLHTELPGTDHIQFPARPLAVVG